MSSGVRAVLAGLVLVVGAAMVAAVIVNPGEQKGGEDKKASGLTVASVEGSTISLVDPDGATLSAQVDADTVVKRGGEEITLADLQAGDVVEVRPRPDGDGQTHLTRITVKSPYDGSLTND